MPQFQGASRPFFLAAGLSSQVLAKGRDTSGFLIFFLTYLYQDLDNPAVPSKLKAVTLLELVDRERAQGRVRSQAYEAHYVPLALSDRLKWLGRCFLFIFGKKM